MSGTGTTIGLVGSGWRATVTPWGGVVPADGSPPLDWAIAGDERWYLPRAERSVRQELLRGVPVVETRLRVGHGDAVHRAYALADRGGLTVVEVENRSSHPFAVAFTRRDLLTSRPIPDVPVVGIDLPPGTWIAPVGHRASVRVALGHRAPGPGPLPEQLPPADQVARGWEQQVEIGARFDDGGAAAVPVAALRAAVLLDGPGDAPASPDAYLLAARELVELGAGDRSDVDDVAAAAERLARRYRRAADVPWEVDAAVEAAWHVLRIAGERRGADDAVRLRRALPPAVVLSPDPPAGVGALAWLRRAMAVDDRHRAVDLLPAPLPQVWAGRDVAAHGLRLGGGTVSVAVRWHGHRPVLLWESEGVRRLTCTGLDPAWSTAQPSGEALLATAGRGAGR